MKAIGYFEPLPLDQPQALVELELPRPEPGPHDLLVAVQAVSVNPVDVKVRAKAVPAPGEPRVLGFDAAGVVEAVGAAVTLFRPGDAVYYAGAIDRPGSNAQYHLVDERLVGRKPRSLSFAEAAALPLTAITAWELLFERLGLTREVPGQGRSLLVINGAGGVGSILLQLARRLTGLNVIATASRSETIAWSRAQGAHHVINHREPLAPQLEALGLAAVDYIASLTATDENLGQLAQIIAPQGRLAVIDDPVALDIAPFKRKSVSVHWEMMFTRSLYQTPDQIAQHQLLNQVAELVEAGQLRTTLSEDVGPITVANLRRVHALVESGRAIGKTVLAGWGA